MIPDGAMMADLVMLSAVAPLSLSPKSNILPGLVFGGQVNLPTRRDFLSWDSSVVYWATSLLN